VRRREFITLGSAAAAWPLAARAQQPAMPVVGFVSSRSVDRSARPVAAFNKGLSETGYIEGQNVMVEYHWLSGQHDRLPSLMADLVRRRVAVIATAGDPPTLAAKAATATIPIAFGISGDPVGHGLVASLARPGGNATGINFLNTEATTKRLGLLHELVPKAVRFALLVNPTNTASAEPTLRDVPEAARAMGLQIQILNPAPAARSRRPSPLLYAIVPTPCSSPPTGFSMPDACNSRRSRRATGYPQPIALARLSKPAG
jgi:ABC-type uncharacterized transport system substrate-binding protein